MRRALHQIIRGLMLSPRQLEFEPSRRRGHSVKNEFHLVVWRVHLYIQVMQNRSEREHQVQLGDRAAQATVGAESEGHVDAGLLVFGTFRKVAIDVKAIRLREKFRAVMRHSSRKIKPGSRRYDVASKIEGVDRAPDDQTEGIEQAKTL